MGAREAAPYTSADSQIATYITQGVHELFPDDSILAEDGPGIVKPGSSGTWVLDPIDGTIPFMLHIPSFMVSLYKVENNGVVYAYAYDPTQDLLYVSHQGGHTFCNGLVVQVSEKKSLVEAQVAISGHVVEQLPWLYQALRDAGAYVVLQEGLVFRGMLVASGRIDATIQSTFRQFESGTVMLAVENAGGIVKDTHNRLPQLFATNNDVIITNKHLHPLLKDIMTKN